MRDDHFQSIPDAGDQRRVSSVLTRIYRDIGLAAVADALRLPTEGFEPDMIESLERGEILSASADSRACAGWNRRLKNRGRTSAPGERNRWFT